MKYQFATVELRAIGPEKTTDDLVEMLDEEGMFRPIQEVMWMMTFGAQTELRTVVEIGRGDFYSVEVPIPVILSVIGQAGTDRFWLIHNHPSGNVKPTDKDVQLSKRIMLVANMANAYFEDHIIVGPPDKLWSMKESGHLKPRKIQLTSLAAQVED